MLSPSFNAHSSATLADIAARVIEEFRNEPHPDTANLFDWIEPEPERGLQDNLLQFHGTEHARVGDCEEEEGIDEFEFAFIGGDANCSPISADELFHNGQIKPVRPVDFDLLLGAVKIDGGDSRSKTTPSSGRTSLRKLIVEDRDASCSSSEADDLETVPPGTYCVWAPNKPPGGAAVGASGRKCKKSSSTGSSKRWKLRDLIHRSNSDGKDTFLFLSPAAAKKTAAEAKISGGDQRIAGKGSADEGPLNCAAASAHYAKGKTTREGEKKKSYLPYKQDIMGILANVNGLSRNLHPF